MGVCSTYCSIRHHTCILGKQICKVGTPLVSLYLKYLQTTPPLTRAETRLSLSWTLHALIRRAKTLWLEL